MSSAETEKWEESYVHLRRNPARRRSRIASFDLPSGGLILDYGCGDGLNLSILRELGFRRLVGIEISWNLVRHARNAAVLQADGLETPFADCSFDAVFVDSVLHHVDVEPAVREIKRILRPGGRLAFVEPGRDAARWMLDRITMSPLARPLPVLGQRQSSLQEEWDTYSRWLEIEKKVPSIVEQSGLTVLRVRREPLNLFLEAVRNDNQL